MTAWSRGGNLDRAEFAARFFGRNAGDPVAMALHIAAVTAKISGNPDALRDAAEHLSSAMWTIGLHHLSPMRRVGHERHRMRTQSAHPDRSDPLRLGSGRPNGESATSRQPISSGYRGSSQVALLVIPGIGIPTAAGCHG